MLSRIATLLICVLLVAGAQAKPEPSFTSHFSVKNQRSCFTGPFSTHEKWANVMLRNSKNKEESYAKFSQRFSPADFERYKNSVDCLAFTYLVDGVLVKGFMVKPKVVAENKKLPVIIYNRGGNASRKHTTKFGLVFRQHMPLALEGYIVLMSQYRGAEVWRPGVKFDTGKDEFGGKDVDDVLALLPIAEGMKQADADNVGLFGWSRGAMMSYLAAKRSDKFKAIVTGGGPTDLFALIEQRPKMESEVLARFIPNYQQDKTAQLKARSVLYWPEQLPRNLPVLMLHGKADKRVAVEQSIALAEKFKALNHPHKLRLFDKGNHGLFGHQKQVMSEVINWFNLYLKGRN